MTAERCGAKLEPFVRPSEWDGKDVSVVCDAEAQADCWFRNTGYWLIKGELCKHPQEVTKDERTNRT